MNDSVSFDVVVYDRGKTFSTGLNHLGGNNVILREGWNGKNMFLTYCHSHTVNEHTVCKELKGIKVKEHILMYTVDRELVPWLASQTDMLASDWCLGKLYFKK